MFYLDTITDTLTCVKAIFFLQKQHKQNCMKLLNLEKENQIIDLKNEILELKENHFNLKESINESKQLDKKREAELLEKNEEIVRLKECISQTKQLSKEKESKSRQEQLYKEKLLKDHIELKNILFEKEQKILRLEKSLNFLKEDQETKSFHSAYAIRKRQEERAKEEEQLRSAAYRSKIRLNENVCIINSSIL